MGSIKSRNLRASGSRRVKHAGWLQAHSLPDRGSVIALSVYFAAVVGALGYLASYS